jgi:agmatinase
MDALTELSHLLRPAGYGLYLVSTGAAERQAVAAHLYGFDGMRDATGNAQLDEAIADAHARALARIADARVIVLGVPSDVGAGYRRGANLAPLEVRRALLAQRPDWKAYCDAEGIVDIGDVRVVPQLLHDDMLSNAQRIATQDALFENIAESERRALPVAPLSVTQRVLARVFELNPSVKPFVMGGDHSVAWPVVEALFRRSAGPTLHGSTVTNGLPHVAGAEVPQAARAPFAIVQPDAHTDLLEHRLGIRYCFATWSYHANELLGRNGHLVQVGIRATRHSRGHWESSLGVRQFWADECLAHPERTLDAIEAYVRALGVPGVYFSNDIDGTDEAFGDATGTPEPGGLTPEFVLTLLDRLARSVGLVGADLMEVAPPLGESAESRRRTLELAARYAEASVKGLVTRR